MKSPPESYSARVFRGLPGLWRTNRFRLAARRLEELGVRGKTVVDFGCADGYGVRFWAPIAGRIIGVDSDERQLAEARRTYRSFSHVRFVHTADFDYQGDVMVALEVFEHMHGVSENIAVLRRFLAMPGRAVFVTLPLEVGLTFQFKRLCSRAFPGSCLLHEASGYDYRPLLRAIDREPSLAREAVTFEPFRQLGGLFNRGLCLTVTGSR
jgi:cyclopropane fatty-acyl-phospholipid synthase-like methyltransferase